MTTSRSFPLLHPLFPSPCPPHHPGLGPATPTIWEEGGHPPALSTPILNNLPPLQHGLGVGARAVVVSRSRQAGAVGGGGFPPGRCYFGSWGRAILVGLGDNGGKVPKDGVGVLEPELWLLRVGLGSSCCFWRSVWGVRQFSCLGYQGKGLESEMWDFFLLCFSGERPGRVFPFQLAPWRCRGGSRGGTACLVNGAGALLQETSGAERRGQGCVPPQKKPWRVSRCPGSPACERGCVTDPLSAGYGERGGRSSLPLLVRHFGDVSVRFLEQAGIPLPPGPSAPSRSVTRSGNFITRLGTMPRSQEGWKPNQWTRTKCRTSLVGPRFLHPAWACSPGAALPSWSGTTSPCLLPPSGPERRRGP